MLETHGAVVKIDRIEVKINLDTPWKINRAVEMINKNVDIDYIVNSLKI
jgi:metal-sulfur cluster biosynthetic enzyme